MGMKQGIWFLGTMGGVFVLAVTFPDKAMSQAKISKDSYPLAKVKSARFAVTDSMTMNGEVKLHQHTITKVAFARPSSLRIEMTLAHPSTDPTQVTVLLKDVFVSNGKQQYTLSTASQEYYLEKANPDLRKLEAFRSEVIFSSNPFREYPFVSQGKKRMGRTMAYLYELMLPAPADKQKKIRIEFWLSAVTRLPLRLSEFDKTATGWKEVLRYDYRDWQLNVKLPATTFAMTPPKDTTKVPAPK